MNQDPPSDLLGEHSTVPLDVESLRIAADYALRAQEAAHRHAENLVDLEARAFDTRTRAVVLGVIAVLGLVFMAIGLVTSTSVAQILGALAAGGAGGRLSNRIKRSP